MHLKVDSIFVENWLFEELRENVDGFREVLGGDIEMEICFVITRVGICLTTMVAHIF